MKKYNLSAIMKDAWRLVKSAKISISYALHMAWEKAKNGIKNAVIDSFNDYNARRYGLPWVCIMTEDGQHDFSERVGMYTGNKGEAGNLVVFKPIEGRVYGFGRKDYRGNNTYKAYAKWTGEQFVSCDKLGR